MASPLPNKGYPEGVFAHGIPLGEFGIAKTYLACPFHAGTAGALARYLGAVIADFFALQWAVHLRFRRIRVVSVDHPLDSLVPFRPELSALYLDFINFWIRSLTMLFDTLGTKKAVPHAARFFRQLTLCYTEAARMYRFCMSTTVRPPSADPLLKKIRGCDPHLLCVPSLHVAIVCFTWAFYRDLFRRCRADFSPCPGTGETKRFEKELRAGAAAIIETVLYVKQHSVNCISAALYMICRIFPDLFTIADAVSFINSLFAGDEKGMAAKDRADIVDYINFQYERLLLEGLYTDDWVEPVKRWITEYSPG